MLCASGVTTVTFRSLDTLKEAMDIEVLLDTTVTGIDTSKKVLHLNGIKKDIKFDKVRFLRLFKQM